MEGMVSMKQVDEKALDLQNVISYITILEYE